jgi:hypothetical protein
MGRAEVLQAVLTIVGAAAVFALGVWLAGAEDPAAHARRRAGPAPRHGAADPNDPALAEEPLA